MARLDNLQSWIDLFTVDLDSIHLQHEIPPARLLETVFKKTRTSIKYQCMGKNIIDTVLVGLAEPRKKLYLDARTTVTNFPTLIIACPEDVRAESMKKKLVKNGVFTVQQMNGAIIVVNPGCTSTVRSQINAEQQIHLMVSELKLNEAPVNSLHLHGIDFGTWVVSYLAKIIPTQVRCISLSGPWYNGFQLATHYVSSSVVTTLCHEASYGWDTAENMKALLTSNNSCVVEVAVCTEDGTTGRTETLWRKFMTDFSGQRDFRVLAVSHNECFRHKPAICTNTEAVLSG